ncbi:MAG: class I SAM-dependent RNA methyltransferase [Firmicutes bacterium]|nr:class I SAM-dependent RNA methyltransferase [Bacillota bacterium]
MNFELIATATFGLEAVVRREVENLGYEIIKTEDGKITYSGDERAIVRSNLWLRSADRVLVKLAEFDAGAFEELFRGVKAIAWEEIVPKDGRVIVTGTSVKSALHSVPACQSIGKKAIVERLCKAYNMKSLSETGSEYVVKLTLLKDRVTVTLDTSGAGLHKRGYRLRSVEAPIKETLAAAMIELSFWRKDRILADPCCGSGTIPIEGAMIGKNIAPGLTRNFASESWGIISKKVWEEERTAARDAIDNDQKLKIVASDIDAAAISVAKANAKNAGVGDAIEFVTGNMEALRKLDAEQNVITISNPPYGKRIGEEEEMKTIYEAYNYYLKKHPEWSLFVITADKNAERKIRKKPADKKRKLYNGKIETCYYQFYGEKPKK